MAPTEPSSLAPGCCPNGALSDAGDLFCEVQGPNLFTGKTLSPHAHMPAPGAGFCLLSSSGGLCLSYIHFLPFQPTYPFPKSKSNSWFPSASSVLELHLPMIRAPKCTLRVPLLLSRNPKHPGHTLEGDPFVRSPGGCVGSSPHPRSVCWRLAREHSTSLLRNPGGRANGRW